MRDEGISDGLVVLFICLVVAWALAIVLINLPHEIGSLLGWPLLGKFPVNVSLFYILIMAGWIVLFIIFRLVFRALGTKQKEA